MFTTHLTGQDLSSLFYTNSLSRVVSPYWHPGRWVYTLVGEEESTNW